MTLFLAFSIVVEEQHDDEKKHTHNGVSNGDSHQNGEQKPATETEQDCETKNGKGDETPVATSVESSPSKPKRSGGGVKGFFSHIFKRGKSKEESCESPKKKDKQKKCKDTPKRAAEQQAKPEQAEQAKDAECKPCDDDKTPHQHNDADAEHQHLSNGDADVNVNATSDAQPTPDAELDADKLQEKVKDESDVTEEVQKKDDEHPLPQETPSEENGVAESEHHEHHEQHESNETAEASETAEKEDQSEEKGQEHAEEQQEE